MLKPLFNLQRLHKKYLNMFLDMKNVFKIYFLKKKLSKPYLKFGGFLEMVIRKMKS